MKNGGDRREEARERETRRKNGGKILRGNI